MGGRQERLAQVTQGALTSALLRLSRASRPVVCFTAGHGERDPADGSIVGASALAGVLKSLAFDIEPVGLAAPGAATALGRCAVVVVAGARVPFLANELELLSAHAQHDGRLLVLADGTADEPRRQLNTVLAPWGLSIEAGVVTDASTLANDPTSVVSLDFASGSSPPVRRLNEEGIPVVLTNVLPVQGSQEARDRNAYVELVRSSPHSWSGEGAARRTGPFGLAALSDWSHLGGTEHAPEVARTRIGVVGTAEGITNGLFDMFGNREFATALVQWVAQEDDVLAAGRPPTGFSKVVLTAAQKDRLVRQGIVFPALAVLFPLPWAAWRLRRG
jgi:hypothetical protein